MNSRLVGFIRASSQHHVPYARARPANPRMLGQSEDARPIRGCSAILRKARPPCHSEHPPCHSERSEESRLANSSPTARLVINSSADRCAANESKMVTLFQL